jgi:hypothetical protein
MTFCKVITMENSLPQCNQCSSPVTDSIEIEIENLGRVKLGKYIDGSWTCNDCMREEKLSTASLNHDDSNSVHHEHTGVANKSDVSPNTPKADEVNQLL